MLKSKQSLTSARRSLMAFSNVNSTHINGQAEVDSSDMEESSIDLEIGIPHPLHRPRRKNQKQNRAFLAVQVIELLQRRHKVPSWMLLVGASAVMVCAVYLFGAMFSALLLSGPASRFALSLPQPRRLHHDYGRFSKLRNLVMVAGHSVYTSGSCENPEKEGSWFLESYQKHPGQASTFLDHIKGGIEAASMDDNALLLFSGGETRKDAGPRSEAQSYWSVAESSDWFGAKQDVRWRALTEEHARDSFENLLFSICRFKELTGNYPHNITVVSYDFKENRFANLHRVALGFPSSRFFYKGTPSSPSSAEAASKGETNVQMLFQEDPYGCIGPLHLKRVARDPFIRTIPYPHGCPELKEIFSYCGSSIFPGILPWD